MLLSLHIRDFAIIERLEIDFGTGLNIITGETGAGKSIVVGALKLLLGARASNDMIRAGARKAVIEGRFDLTRLPAKRAAIRVLELDDLPELIMRREVGDSASRAFVNDSPVGLATLRSIAEDLVDLHGQHDQQSLLRREVHRQVLDSFGGLDTRAESVRAAFGEKRDAATHLRELEARSAAQLQQAELFDFQKGEIDEVNPKPDEEDHLHVEHVRLANATRLRTESGLLHEQLYGESGSVYDRLSSAIDSLEQLARLDPSLTELVAEVRSALISVGDVASTLRGYAEDIEADPDRLEEVQLRLGALEKLNRKYGGSVAAVIEYRDEIGRAPTRDGIDREYAVAASALADKSEHLLRLANELSTARKATAKDLEPKVEHALSRLGMAKSRFEVHIAARGSDEVTESGIDDVEFYVSTNPGEPSKSLIRAASGGEISRIMLAIKAIIASRASVPVLVFDEIDIGISGAVAQAVGVEMYTLSRERQVITITHLPQIAAVGDTHFVVEKSDVGGRTRAEVRRLGDDERAAQIARLISGARVTENAVASARDLMLSATDAGAAADSSRHVS